MIRSAYNRIFAGALSLAVVVPVHASFIEPSELRGGGWVAPTTTTLSASSQTTTQSWDVFSSPFVDFGGNAPDVLDVNAFGSASVFQTTEGAFITSGGNIYSFSTPTTIEVNIPVATIDSNLASNPVDVTVLVQFETLGNLVNLSTLLIDGVAPVDFESEETAIIGGFGGLIDIDKHLFQIEDYDGSQGDLTLSFSSLGSSLSLDKLRIDTIVQSDGFAANAIPEPGSLAILSALGLVIARRSRRRHA